MARQVTVCDATGPLRALMATVLVGDRRLLMGAVVVGHSPRYTDWRRWTIIRDVERISSLKLADWVLARGNTGMGKPIRWRWINLKMLRDGRCSVYVSSGVVDVSCQLLGYRGIGAVGIPVHVCSI